MKSNLQAKIWVKTTGNDVEMEISMKLRSIEYFASITIQRQNLTFRFTENSLNHIDAPSCTFNDIAERYKLYRRM